MNDHVVGVDQNPVRSGQTFDPHVLAEFLFDAVGELVGHRRDLAGLTSRSYYHRVGFVLFAREWIGYEIDRLVVVERLQHYAMKFIHVDWRAAGIGAGLSGTFGQGVS